MAQSAPEIPTTRQLEMMYASDFDQANIIDMRAKVSRILTTPGLGLLAIAGPCSLTGESTITNQESNDLTELMSDDLVTLQRRNFWKPRSNPEDWHGPETTDPEETYQRIAKSAMIHANGAAEIATMRHQERYGKLLSFGWFGARNTNLAEQIEIAKADKLLPLGIKNSLDGNIEESLLVIDTINRHRGLSSAPVTLIYRGGDNAMTPTKWEEQVRRAYQLTDGQMILDLAHGGEMAHDPSKKAQKSILGQIACANHAIAMAQDGILMAGYLMESSDIISLTDPNMPHTDGLETIKQLRDASRQKSR